MKKAFILLSLSLLSIATINAQSKSKKTTSKKQTATATLTTFEADNASSMVQWTGKKVGGAHNGKVSIKNGTLISNGKAVTGGTIVMDMNSITCDDLTDAEYNAKLVGHLKNEDFFNTAQYPEAKLEINRISPIGKNVHKVTGKLTIKDKTHPVAFNMQINTLPEQIIADGVLVFDRTKFDVKYGSTLFGAAADKAIENNVKLDIHFVANKK